MFAGEDQRGLFGKAGIDPKTGKDSGYMGLSGYFNRLFDDPGRMAMLSGGLSAMDPNSYYDKQGFGSPWTGLRGAFGAAQGGAKSVHDARKAKADLEKTKAETLGELGRDYKWEHSQSGDSTIHFSEEMMNRRMGELRKLYPGKSEEELSKMAYEDTVIKSTRGLTPSQQREVRKQESTMKNMLKLTSKIAEYTEKHPGLSSELTGSFADVVNYVPKLVGAGGVWPSRTEFKKDMHMLRAMISPAVIQSDQRLHKMDKENILALVSEDFSTTGVDVRSAVESLNRYIRMSAGEQGIKLGETGGGGTTEERKAKANAFLKGK